MDVEAEVLAETITITKEDAEGAEESQNVHLDLGLGLPVILVHQILKIPVLPQVVHRPAVLLPVVHQVLHPMIHLEVLHPVIHPDILIIEEKEESQFMLLDQQDQQEKMENQVLRVRME